MVAALHFVEEEIFYFIQATERPGNSIRGKIKDTLVPADDCDDDDDGDVFWDSYIFSLLPFKLFYSILHCNRKVGILMPCHIIAKVSWGQNESTHVKPA